MLVIHPDSSRAWCAVSITTNQLFPDLLGCGFPSRVGAELLGTVHQTSKQVPRVCTGFERPLLVMDIIGLWGGVTRWMHWGVFRGVLESVLSYRIVCYHLGGNIFELECILSYWSVCYRRALHIIIRGCVLLFRNVWSCTRLQQCVLVAVLLYCVVRFCVCSKVLCGKVVHLQYSGSYAVQYYICSTVIHIQYSITYAVQ